MHCAMIIISVSPVDRLKLFDGGFDRVGPNQHTKDG
jgi:hypothetical protein